jgi:hypothetical protein
METGLVHGEVLFTRCEVQVELKVTSEVGGWGECCCAHSGCRHCVPPRLNTPWPPWRKRLKKSVCVSTCRLFLSLVPTGYSVTSVHTAFTWERCCESPSDDVRSVGGHTGPVQSPCHVIEGTEQLWLWSLQGFQDPWPEDTALAFEID